MEESHESAVPIRVVQIDRVDPLRSECCRPPLRTLLDAGEPGGVDQLCSAITQGHKRSPVRCAEPQTFESIRTELSGHRDDGAASGGVLEVEGEREPGAAPGVELRKRRYVLGELLTCEITNGALASPNGDDTVVIENGYSVGSDPHVALEPGGAELECQSKRLEGVLRCVSPSTAMSKRDRFVDQGGKPLLHAAEPYRDAPRLRAVFNFSGSEIVFILLLALIILGPEKLPEAMRRFGQTYSEIKKLSSGFQSEFKQAFDEPMREMKATADELRRAASFPMDNEPKVVADPPVHVSTSVAGPIDEPDTTPAVETPDDGEAGERST